MINQYIRSLSKRINEDSWKEVHLSGNNVSDDDAKILAKALEKNKTAVLLILRQNRIRNEGAIALGITVEKNRTLIHIDLSRNSIGADGARGLSNGLEKNFNLKILDLNGNSIGDVGASALSFSLEKNNALQTIYLGGNCIGDAGAKALSVALENNTTLQNLILSNNKIGDDGATALGVLITKNQTLKTLDVFGNIFSFIGLEELNKGYLLNSVLIEVRGFGNVETIFPALFRAFSSNPEAVKRRLTNLRVPQAYRTLISCWEESSPAALIDVPKIVVDRGTVAVKNYFLAFNASRDTQHNSVKGESRGKQHTSAKDYFVTFQGSGDGLPTTANSDATKELLPRRESKPRLVVSMVGSPNAGKTSLIKSMLDKEHQGCATNREIEGATVGVESSRFEVDEDENSPIFIFRDFGGQEDYERSHSFFQQNRCIMFLVVDLANYQTESFEQNVGYYYEKMQSARISRDSSVLYYAVIGTKIDRFAEADQERLDIVCKNIMYQLDDLEHRICKKITQELDAFKDKLTENTRNYSSQGGVAKARQKVFQQNEQLSERVRFLTMLLQTRPVRLAPEVFRVSNQRTTDGRPAIGVPGLIDLLVRIAPKREHGQVLPQPYVDLLNYFDGQKKTAKGKALAPILSFSDTFKNWCERGDNDDQEEFHFSETGFRLALQVLGDVGEILWYTFEDSHIFIEPPFLMNVVKQISRHDMLDENAKGGLCKYVTNQEELEQAKLDYRARGLLHLKHLYKFDCWRDLNVETTIQVLLKLLEKFGLAYVIDNSLYIPSAVLEEMPTAEHIRVDDHNAIRIWKFPTFKPKGMIPTFTVLFHGETFIKNKARYSHRHKSISILVNSPSLPSRALELTLQQKESGKSEALELILHVTGPHLSDCFDFIRMFESIIDKYLQETFACLFTVKYAGLMFGSRERINTFGYGKVIAARENGETFYIPDLGEGRDPVDINLLLGPKPNLALPTNFGEWKYDYFISYRSKTEDRLVNWFYLYLSRKKTIFLDTKELSTGQLWQDEFLEALSNSKHFVFFMSWHEDDSGSIGQMMEFSKGDYCDNVLAEILFALCLIKEKRVLSFTPVFIGGIEKDMYLDFPFKKVQSLPDIISHKTLETLEQKLQRLNITIPPDIKTLSVKAAIIVITKYQGIKLADLGKVILAQEIAGNKLLELKD
jgi:GTPase SAR1 family protein